MRGEFRLFDRAHVCGTCSAAQGCVTFGDVPAVFPESAFLLQPGYWFVVIRVHAAVVGFFISQKARFAGICFLYASQSATAPNGLDPSVRTNLSSRIIVGAKVADSVRDNVLNDAKSAPKVGEYLISSGVSVGTGVCELGGKEACVYKSFYVDDKAHGLEFSDILRQHLMQRRPATACSLSR